MGLSGEFLEEVQSHVAALTQADDAMIVDAGTGAGETTLQVAEAMRGGKLITVDSDAASWEQWARPALESAGLLERVTFLQADLRDLSGIGSDSVHMVISHSTLSAVGIWAGKAIREFHRILKPGSRCALADLIPENESEPDEGNVAALSWRLCKAASHCAGEHHYDELPTEWVKKELIQAGFDVLSFELDPVRHMASRASYEEWRRIDLAGGVEDEALAEAISRAQRELVAKADKESLTDKTGHYACWAAKPG